MNRDIPSPAELRRRIVDALPEHGLLAQGNWLVSPEPFPLSPDELQEIEHLGYHFLLFYRACDLLYRQSVNGKGPPWVATLLDAGKPDDLIALARQKAVRPHFPRVIRPDLLLTSDGFAASELDNLPGGIGMTAWLNRTYAALGFDVAGSGEGMIDGFASIVGSRDVVISEESTDYRAEMAWIAGEIAKREEPGPTVVHERDWVPGGRDVYRFFELFDLDNLTSGRAILERMVSGELDVTPPPKPWLEEKLLFALFWLAPLREFWRRELGERHYERLKGVFPYTWVVDPTPLPYHAGIPRLDVNRWEEVGQFSQRQRDFVLKISGFSPLAWGSRGVKVGSDLPQKEWSRAVAEACESFGRNPWVLQEFRHPRLVEHPYFDPETGELRRMSGRVRLCPYYFVAGEGAVQLGGILATIVPADKKLVHGMRDAILVPCSVSIPDEPVR